MVADERLPQTLLFAGPAGVGKTTVARHVAAGMNCSNGPGRPCGTCSPCTRILSTDLSRQEYRDRIAEHSKLPAAKRASSPLVIAAHPDVLIFPPDGPMRIIGIEQARLLRSHARIRPCEGRRRIFVIREAERANSEAANALLKTLEEPASDLTIILTATNPFLLPATIRSRSIPFQFGALAPEEIATFLRSRDDVPESVREKVAAWSGGCPGVAITIDVGEFLARRSAMLALVRTALAKGDFARLSGAIGSFARKRSEGIDRLAAMLGSLLRDLLRLHLGIDRGLTHHDIADELRPLAARADFAWTERAFDALDELEKLQQTNINKQIGFEAYALGLRR